MKIKQPFKIALYIRVSTEEQAENPEGSIRNQEDRLRSAIEYKNRHGNFGEIKGVYTDAGISAKNMKRPKLQEMLKAIQNHEIDLVMVTELSRLSRNTRDFIEMWDMMRDHNCSFTSLREDFDTTNAAGEMVLFQLMNLAQFERRQTSERVEANIAVRAARGLYNGGHVPVGYKLIPEKPGYLDVDESMANVIRECFRVFLKEGCLSHAAKYLNDQGLTLQKQNEGGGGFKRLGYFTVDNLQGILRQKAYVGIKTYTHRGEKKETKAVWPAIIDDVTFARVNKQLDENKSKYKPFKQGKFPYLLTGLMFCKCCGSHMPGKSATGRSGKVGYYEHAWATKRDSTLSKKIFRCEPHRVPSRILEPLVWSKIQAFVTAPIFSKEIFAKVRAHHAENPHQKDKERLKAKLSGINSQIDALSERLSELPKTISAEPIYKQMTKLQQIKGQYESEFQTLHSSNRSSLDRIAQLETFDAFTRHYKDFVKNNADFLIRKEIAKKFVKRIEVGVDSVKIHFIVDQDHYSHELALQKENPGLKKAGVTSAAEVLQLKDQNTDKYTSALAASAAPPSSSTFFKFYGSNTLTIGAPARS